MIRNFVLETVSCVSIWLPCVLLTPFKFYLHGRIKLIAYFKKLRRIERESRNIKRQGCFSS